MDIALRARRYARVSGCSTAQRPASLVVNNCAAAGAARALETLARGHGSSSGAASLIQIGGESGSPTSCRSGAVLREVGTTNRTSP
jgi:seryl-tRNA(Sec) selenium transferase